MRTLSVVRFLMKKRLRLSGFVSLTWFELYKKFLKFAINNTIQYKNSYIIHEEIPKVYGIRCQHILYIYPNWVFL